MLKIKEKVLIRKIAMKLPYEKDVNELQSKNNLDEILNLGYNIVGCVFIKKKNNKTLTKLYFYKKGSNNLYYNIFNGFTLNSLLEIHPTIKTKVNENINILGMNRPYSITICNRGKGNKRDFNIFSKNLKNGTYKYSKATVL